ncbi:hypothetical protein [Merdimonas faecis]|nr:hypothetical protein [Merdimonas faecis]
MKIKAIQNSPEKQKAMQRRLVSYQRQFQKSAACHDHFSSSKKGDRI